MGKLPAHGLPQTADAMHPAGGKFPVEIYDRFYCTTLGGVAGTDGARRVAIVCHRDGKASGALLLLDGDQAGTLQGELAMAKSRVQTLDENDRRAAARATEAEASQ